MLIFLHFCLAIFSYKQYKLRWYTEQLPFDNYSTVHCTNGWAHGEFFQGGWSCHGGATVTNTPPELLDIENDPAERYPLQDTAVSLDHLAYIEATEPKTSALRSFPYYREIGAMKGDLSSILEPSCGSNVTRKPGCILAGYEGRSIPSTASSLYEICQKRCCADPKCNGYV